MGDYPGNRHFFGLGTVLVVIGFIGLLWLAWRPILRLVTEDSVLRIDRFFLQYWVFLQCCGICDGEWTRHISWCCCCIPALKGRNLKRALGEYLGLASVCIRVSNITLGSLPRHMGAWFPSNPDVYLQITPDELQPLMRTETVSQANTTCMQFTTGLSLLVKNHVNEDPVRFCVRELRLAGSSDVADCYVCPTRLVAWARRGKTVRIQLNHCPGYEDRLSGPWMLLRLSSPEELPILRTTTGSFHPIISTELLEPKAMSRERQPPPACICCALCETAPVVDEHVLPIQTSMAYRMYPHIDKFREHFPLLNERGARVIEPQAQIGRDLLRTRMYIRATFVVLVTLLALYLVVRFCTMTCFEEYRQRKIIWRYATTNSTDCSRRRTLQPLPLSEKDWFYIRHACNLYEMDVAKFVSQFAHHKLHFRRKISKWQCLCNHDLEEVVGFCQKYPDRMAVAYSTPRVFQFLPCWRDTCQANFYLDKLDRFFLCMAALWLASSCCCWTLAQQNLRWALLQRGDEGTTGATPRSSPRTSARAPPRSPRPSAAGP